MTKDDMATTPSSALSVEQTRALFDILCHYETYREIAAFKSSEAITSYGFPFKTSSTLATAPGTPRSRTPNSFVSSSPACSKRNNSSPMAINQTQTSKGVSASSAPILQLLLTRLVLPMPGICQLPREFWNIRVQTLLERLGKAELSESYDKGALGTRKVLATGLSAIVEMLGRGLLGGIGVDKQEHGKNMHRKYNHENADDLILAWENVVQSLVYDELVNVLFDHFIEHDDLETLSPMVEASARHNIFHLATLIHQIFVLSPDGQYLLKLIENFHSLVPYRMIKQTLRIGNAATMINGIMRILLAKLSVASITNWFGLTQNADDGMNLLQQIISLVLDWDANDFKKSAEKAEKTKGGPTEEMLRMIKEYIEHPRSDHDTVRSASEQNSQSIITSIFNASNPQLNCQLTDSQHTQCLEYYSCLLSVRDRNCITAAFCRQSPDMFTQAIKDIIAAYEPIIRTVHSNVDLREHFDALQGFIEELIKTSKPKKGPSSRTASSDERLPSVEDYVDLLMRHRGFLYKWIHAVASQCPEIWESLRVWGNNTLGQFKKKTTKASYETDVMSTLLNKIFVALDLDTQKKIHLAIDRHSEYLSTLNHLSQARLQYLVAAPGSSDGSIGGPGVYLARWQALLDETPITPSKSKGPVRRGRDVKHAATKGKTGLGGKMVEVDGAAQGRSSIVEAPDVSVVVAALGDAFRQEVQALVTMI